MSVSSLVMAVEKKTKCEQSCSSAVASKRNLTSSSAPQPAVLSPGNQLVLRPRQCQALEPENRSHREAAAVEKQFCVTQDQRNRFEYHKTGTTQ